jgi:hypothetical protein
LRPFTVLLSDANNKYLIVFRQAQSTNWFSFPFWTTPITDQPYGYTVSRTFSLPFWTTEDTQHNGIVFCFAGF